jgi:acyl-CoA thioesterase-2
MLVGQEAPPTGEPVGEGLRRAMDASLDRLVASLDLQQVGHDRFLAPRGPGQFERMFGGQLLAQALVAAGSTVSDQVPESLHAYFVGAGDPEEDVELQVERVRDGRSVSTRRVTITQGGRPLLTAIAAFHGDEAPAEPRAPASSDPTVEHIPLLQDWVTALRPHQQDRGRTWIDRPPPVEIRIDEPPSFLGGVTSDAPRRHWMRAPGSVGDDPLLHAALLAHASDYLLLDMVMRARPDRVEGRLGALSLDHSLWFHRPVRFDHWHRYDQELVALSGQRGLARGAIRAGGALVATVTQEGLLRPMGPPA